MAKRLHFNDKKYHSQQKKNVAAAGLQVRAAFDRAATQASVIGFSTGFADPNGEFHFDDYPAAAHSIKAALQELHDSIVNVIRRGNSQAWALSQRKNDDMATRIAHTPNAADMAREATKTRNEAALQAFQERKTAGMNLSDRVWSYVGQTKQEFELALEVGLGQGKSADALSRDIRQALREPAKLFRRVRDKETGQLRLSKAAKAYNPGRGVYRSSYKNALRLTATENNMAYRSADHNRWKKTPWIIGIEVKTSSNNHTHEDICDELAGVYPKDFEFIGWHPWCRCYASPLLCSDEEYDALEERMIRGEDVSDWRSKDEVTELPEGFTNWVAENEERIENASSVPYFLQNNFVDGDPRKGALWNTESTASPNSLDAESAAIFLGNLNMSQEYQRILRVGIHEFNDLVDIFPNDLNVVFGSGETAGTLMSWQEGSLCVTTNLLQVSETETFCAARELMSALDKIKAGATELTFNEEYAIESLVHESIHAKARFLDKIGKGTIDEKFMEASTQLCARCRYGDVLRKIGVNAVNEERILTEGYGYSSRVDKLRPLFTRKDGSIDTGGLLNIAIGHDNGQDIIQKKLMRLGMSELEALEWLLKF